MYRRQWFYPLFLVLLATYSLTACRNTGLLLKKTQKKESSGEFSFDVGDDGGVFDNQSNGNSSGNTSSTTNSNGNNTEDRGVNQDVNQNTNQDTTQADNGTDNTEQTDDNATTNNNDNTNTPTRKASILTAAGKGGGPHVRLVTGDPRENEITGFMAYGNFSGGVHIAGGDVTCDGVSDIITGAGEGGGPHVKVYDGTTYEKKFEFFAFEASFTGGVRVAVGDIDGNGCGDIVVARGPGGPPEVVVFSGGNYAGIARFYAYVPGFTGGVFVGTGDTNNNGKDEIITGADAGGGPHALVFESAGDNQFNVLASFYAFAPNFTGGVRVAGGDFNGDGHDDLIASSGPGHNPTVRVFSGKGFNELANFTVYNPAFQGGVFVASGDFNGDGVDDIITGADAGGGSHVKVFNSKNLNDILSSFFAYEGFGGGVRVGAF